MAHLAPAWPEQVLCKENKRKALAEQQRRWMEQRQQELRPLHCDLDEGERALQRTPNQNFALFGRCFETAVAFSTDWHHQFMIEVDPLALNRK